jgi:oligoendopeptidase F
MWYVQRVTQQLHCHKLHALQSCGVDMLSSALIAAACAMFKRLVDELEGLM